MAKLLLPNYVMPARVGEVDIPSEEAAQILQNWGVCIYPGLGDSSYEEAEVPEGWTVERLDTDGRSQKTLLDQNGMQRASIVWATSFGDESYTIKPTTRFNIVYIRYGEIRAEILENGKVIDTFPGERDVALSQALESLEEIYPDWRDFNAYWDE